MNISPSERHHLRELAKRQHEAANLPVMAERRKKWYKLNNGEVYEPLVTFEFNGPREEIYPVPVCLDPLACKIEEQMNTQLTDHSLLNDDRVIPDYISVPIPNNIIPFGCEASHVTTVYSDGRPSMGYAVKHPISDLESDFHLLKKSPYFVDKSLGKANETKREIEEAVGDIIPVKIQFNSFAFHAGYTLVELMGMENMLFSLYDYPDKFHEMMQMFVDDYLEYMHEIEEGGAILPNNDGSHLNQGSWGYTDALPSLDQISGKVTFKDVWGYSNFQETVNMSVEMFDEFFFSYMEQISNKFGLFAYGCCEPVDGLWDKCLSRLKNLRKLSVSPWCNEESIAERIRGKKIVYHRKPSPNFIGVDEVFNEDAFRAHITKTVKAARGCPLEITFRDVITARGEPWRLTKAIEIVKEQYASCWQP
jgi:hypothetical protein